MTYLRKIFARLRRPNRLERLLAQAALEDAMIRGESP